MNPFTPTAGFMDLLTSQQETPILHPTGFETDSPTGESEVPVFSTEAQDSPATPIPRKRNKWTSAEDVVLISAWLNTSKDAVVGNEQRGEAFWKRIASYFAASPNVSNLKLRLPSHFKQRWAKINEMVCKFVGSFEAATRKATSGQNDDDLLKLAHQIYESDYKKKFMLEHAWRELRRDQKWCALQADKDSGKSKRRKLSSGSIQSSEQSEACEEADSSQVRPVGVKAAKAAAKGKGKMAANVVEEGQSLGRIHTIWEIKQNDFTLKQEEHAMKEKLSNRKLLDSLILKSTPLTEIEEELKIKLIRECFP
ncbi:glutathione S-transferase T3-like [Capsella rubella]|uniref:glutathione S-transferase T3-like n=1 Tax=Capsella rubella TaxID=81985 RepID=UPI000CD527AA|nr:glutathione S-transferase T3-like [Capsella rubella]